MTPRLDLSSVLSEPLDWRSKWFPPTAPPTPIQEVGSLGWSALGDDIVYPTLLIKASNVTRNIDLMAQFCKDHQIDIAPHGKTSMSPQIIEEQVAAGAWGITAQVLSHAVAYRRFGVQRVILANQLLEPAGLEWAASVAGDPAFELHCLVDSLEGITQMDRVLSAVGSTHPLKVMVELGIEGGRSGVRGVDAALEVAQAVEGTSNLELSGIEGFDGAFMGRPTEAEQLEGVDSYLSELEDLAWKAASEISAKKVLIVSVGTSAYFDRLVTTGFAARLNEGPFKIVIRCGAYATHDDLYKDSTPMGGRRTDIGELQPALELWGRVLSRPEPTMAVVGMGKRDAPYDVSYPEPVMVHRDGDSSAAEDMTVREIMDHHIVLDIRASADLGVGDLVGFRLAHSCSAFDRWRTIPVVDDEYRIVDAYATFF